MQQNYTGYNNLKVSDGILWSREGKSSRITNGKIRNNLKINMKAYPKVPRQRH